MTDEIKDGGPAFPISVQPDFQHANPGMTLRDYFAGQALAGAAQSSADHDRVLGFLEHKDLVATYAYAMADAMLKARGKQ